MAPLENRAKVSQGLRPPPSGQIIAPRQREPGLAAPAAFSRAASPEGYSREVRYRNEIEVAGEPAAVFAYLADFSNTAEWDPGIAEARRLTKAPTVLGSRFELIALFRGKAQRFEYVVTALVGHRIELHGEGEKALSDDVVCVEPSDGGARVGYQAEIRLKGGYRVLEPLLSSTFRRMGDEALAGLVRTFARSASAQERSAEDRHASPS